MLYHVRMDVHPPHGIDPARVRSAEGRGEGARRRSCSAKASGVHLWRIAGQYSQHLGLRRGEP